MPVRRYTEVVEDTIRQLSTTSNISFFGRGSKARSLLETVGAELVSQSRLMEADMRQGRVSQATGRNLELIADLFNIQPLRRRHAEGAIGDLNLRFYVEPSIGTFGGLTSLPVIAVGDRISTRNTSSGIIYEITELMGSVSPAANVYYVGARAIQSGVDFNVGANSLTTHAYTDTDLKVTNVFPITNGRNDEDQEQLRFRVFNALRSLETANDRALFIAARITPGVGDVRIIPRLFGIGTSAVVVRPSIGTSVPKSMITAARTSINAVKPNSARTIVTPPDVLGFEFNFRVNYSRPMTASEKSRIEGSIISRVNRFFSQLDIGQSLAFADVVGVVLSASGDIKSLGDGTNPLGRCWVYESDIPGDLTVRRRREVLFSGNLTTYSVPTHGLASLEESITVPIVITHGDER